MKPVLKMLHKGFYSYSKGDLSISVVGEPTNFYLNYTDRFTPHESSPWFKHYSITLSIAQIKKILLKCYVGVGVVK